MNSSAIGPITACIGAACKSFIDSVSDSRSCTLINFQDKNQSNCPLFTLNPISFLFDDNLLRYADLQMCCNVSQVLLRPFCVSLLPYCVFYTWIRFFIAIFNEFYVYPLRIKMRVDPLKKKVTKLFKKEIDDFTWVLRLSSIIEIANAVISLWFFKGLQFYSSDIYASNSSMEGTLCLYNSSNYVLKLAAIFWFIAEVITLAVQMFAVSCLSNIHNIRLEGASFYKKNRNWALFWSSIFLVSGGTALCLDLFYKDFKDLRIYYRFYSSNSLSFWLIYSISLVLVLTDRYLVYGSKKQRKALKNKFNLKNFFTNYEEQLHSDQLVLELKEKSIVKKKLQARAHENEEEEKSSLPVEKNELNPQIEASVLAKEVKKIYLEELENHFNEIREMGAGFDQQEDYKTSTSYIGYMIAFHCINGLGYLLMLVAYQHTQSEVGTQVTFHLIGFVVASLSTIAYELSHSYLLYKSFFDPMVKYWKNQSTSD